MFTHFKMSYVGFGQTQQYNLPFMTEAIPSSMRSNTAPRPINCVLSTVYVPSTSGNASASGISTIQVPLGSASYMANPYLRFKLVANRAVGGNSAGRVFKGTARAASAAIANYQTSINSTLVDNVLNYSQTADLLLSHACSSNYLSRDGQVLFDSLADAKADAAVQTDVYVLPLLGLLSCSSGAFPLWAISGTLTINIGWASIGAMFAGLAAAGSIDSVSFQDVALVYDRITVESDFIGKMKAEMAATGAKYNYAFTNYQSLSAVSTQGQNTINTGLNVSSLRAVVLTSPLTAGLNVATTQAVSEVSGLTQFQVSLDGRQVSNVNIDAVNSPAQAFAEGNKCFSRLFDSAVDDISTKATYLTTSFFAGINTCRVAEHLSFQGSAVSVCGIALTQGQTTSTNFITFINDVSLLIGMDGSVDLVR